MGLVSKLVLGIAKSRKGVSTVWLREDVLIPEAKTILFLLDFTQIYCSAHYCSTFGFVLDYSDLVDSEN